MIRLEIIFPQNLLLDVRGRINAVSVLTVEAIAPQSEQPDPQPTSLDLTTHQGITFDDWLDLFLEYAIGLAIANRREEAYQVCAAAKDSIVFQSTKHDFIIHIAWSGRTDLHSIFNIFIVLLCYCAYMLTTPSVCHIHQRRGTLRGDCPTSNARRCNFRFIPNVCPGFSPLSITSLLVRIWTSPEVHLATDKGY